jgi:ADP-heptose:LPS heptosyltransferase
VSAPPVLLAYRALGLGDLLCGVPALRALRDAFPTHRIVLAMPAALEPLAALSGAVDAVLDTPPLAVPALLGADVAVNLHGQGPESHRALLATGPRRLVAFASAEARWPEAGPAPEWRAGEHEVARWCRMLAESGIPADPARLDLPAPPWPAPPAAVGATIVHPGAASPARRWPAARWAEVARAEVAAGRRVVVTGGPGEAALCAAVAGGAGLDPGANLAGRTDAAQLAAAVAAAGRVLCGDTGVAHLATAFGVPSVVLFGPTPPAEWGPPPDRPAHVALHAGGRGDPHGRRPDARLLELSVAAAVAASDGLPPRAVAGAGAG